MGKPGTVETVEVNIDLLDPKCAIVIKSPVLEARGGPARIADVFSPLAVVIKRMSPAKSGNQNTARWRRRHGGAWVQPVNSRIKGVKGL